MNLTITAKGNFSAAEITASLKHFLNRETQTCGLEILAFSENPLSATVAIPENKKHDLRIALNIFAAESGIHWVLETE
ncbi:MAG: hypothetical protein LBR75_01340 [Prevotellaceae bacterium]|jgi:hypothetical protein|nr:hypothetical protein [Prevotellaceae bacterium]